MRSTIEIIGYLSVVWATYKLLGSVLPFLYEIFLAPAPKKVLVEVRKDEKAEKLENYPKFDPKKLETPSDTVFYWDPSTHDYLGEVKVHTAADVDVMMKKAKAAQANWKKSSFETRRLLMKTILKYITENLEQIARVSCRDSGKTSLDAMIGDILPTCEKLTWLIGQGEAVLAREYRSSGRMMVHKLAYVEYEPMGVIGAIVPWNYPFHNLFNPLSAALFAGNAIIIKVSEYASWSMLYYARIIHACLAAVGASPDLVQFLVGYGATGHALVSHPQLDKLIFVGSPGVGRIVAKTAAATLLPVCLELGGKDPFIVTDDVSIDEDLLQTACRGVWQNMGQNCAGPERFFVYEKVYAAFVAGVTRIVQQMSRGEDCGYICMGPRQHGHYQRLVDDAVSKGARLLAGGKLVEGPSSSYYPPTILADIPSTALIAQEEIFGPIMAIFRIEDNKDSTVIDRANGCGFGLSACVFCRDVNRARFIGQALRSGMLAINDLEGVTYMNQSLPFGGVKESGYDRFAGPEGLRGLCLLRSVCVDRFPSWLAKNGIPPPLRYPGSRMVGPVFAQGIIRFFYCLPGDVSGRGQGLLTLLYFTIFPAGDGKGAAGKEGKKSK